jgi:hypothetical protein
MIRYGFQRLALLNSAGYRRAELPLDDSISLIAPNNTGKTSLINALQFLIIIDRRRMDFGAHDVDASRRFYFPNNSAYILLEVALPTTGTVVLGCVGKGVSHEYEYFAYRGELDLDDYRLDDGGQVQQPQLHSHLAKRGKLVFSYSPSEFTESLYGKRNKKRLDQEPDFTVFKLEHPSHVDTFQRVLTRTLRLDKLRSSEVKDYLLTIFRRDLPDSSIDFKAEWDKAFSEVNADRAQYQAALNHRSLIEVMGKHYQRRLELRGKIIYFRPKIDEALQRWEDHYQSNKTRLSEEIESVKKDQSELQLKDRRINAEKLRVEGELKELNTIQARQDALANEFALISDRANLEECLATERSALDAQTALVQNASGRSREAIGRDISTAEKERSQLQRELSTLSDNLYLSLKSILPAEQLDILNRVLNQQAMTLAISDVTLTVDALKTWLAQAETSCPGYLPLPGMKLAVENLTAQHTQRSLEEISQRLSEITQQLEGLNQLLEAAQNLEVARQSKKQLEHKVREIELQVARFDELQELIRTQSERSDHKKSLEGEQTLLLSQLEHSLEAFKALGEKQLKIQSELDTLNSSNQSISKLRESRRDGIAIFDGMTDLPHRSWMGSDTVKMENLADVLSTYHRECGELVQLGSELENKLAQLHAGGLTKFQFSGGSESEILKIVEFANHLSQEAQALERKARSAVINVTACLRELRDGLLTFKNKMRDFNRLLSRRQLSDLSVFKIEPIDEPQLVEAIEQLIKTAEQAETGESFNLFDHGSVLDDDTLNRAKALLIKEGEIRGCLKVEHFFRLVFVVGKAGREPESFADMDSAASNGTVLMAKLVTGLALLYLMQDNRHKVHAVCYLDEASALDQTNQRNLIETAGEFGFALIFASPAPLVTARYCVPITSKQGFNQISRKSWQILEPLPTAESDTSGTPTMKADRTDQLVET